MRKPRDYCRMWHNLEYTAMQIRERAEAQRDGESAGRACLLLQMMRNVECFEDFRNGGDEE